MKVYIICIGEYSDRHIDRVMSDKKTAYDWVARYNNYTTWQKAEIEEFEVDGEATDYRLPFFVSIYGTEVTAELSEASYADFNNVCRDFFGGYYVYVKANSPDQAKKIGCDLIAEYKAREAGIT